MSLSSIAIIGVGCFFAFLVFAVREYERLQKHANDKQE